MSIGVGQSKTEAMFVSASVVKQACKNDVNGTLKKSCRATATIVTAATETQNNAAESGDDDFDSTLPNDDELDEKVDMEPARSQQPPLRKGQALIKGVLYGTGTGRPLPYEPRPLPPPPALPQLQIAAVPGNQLEANASTPIPWTNLYKYLGFMIRSDLLDDHAYARIEEKIKKSAERLFPHHRLVRSWPVGLQLQLLQTIVLSIPASSMPLMTSMRCSTESKTKRLDQLRKKIARSILRLSSSTRHAYIVSEACLGDVVGEITTHRLRLQYALRNHPLREQNEPPIACRVLEIMEREAAHWKPLAQTSLLAPWPVITQRITGESVRKCDESQWKHPEHWWEISPNASAVARVGERERWIQLMGKELDWACHSFAVRPPRYGKQHTAMLHWSKRLQGTDAGSIAKLVPLSCLGPHGCSMTALSRRHSPTSFILSNARQGNSAMQSFPFANADPTTKGAKKKQTGRRKKSNEAEAAAAAAQLAIAKSASNRHKTGKTCHLCTDSDDGPHYDLWHVLFECMATRDLADITAVREKCIGFVSTLCDKIEKAVEANAESMSNTRNAGVSHENIATAIAAVREELARTEFPWDSTPGRWLIYTILLAMPFPAVAVRPDTRPGMAIWRRAASATRKKVPNLHDMPIALPQLPDDQYRLPELVGRLFDVTILSRDVLRPLANAWCSMSESSLLRAGQTVRPLRAAAELKRAATMQDAAESMSTASSSSSTMMSETEP